MKDFDKRKHWEEIYQTKNMETVSWYQPIPTTSIEFFEKLDLPKDATIIDVGGGTSFFVDYLIEQGFKDITVLDISEKALQQTKKRLGNLAERVHWIASDVLDLKTHKSFDFWHDRAAFHFLTNDLEIKKYVQNISKFIKPSGKVVLGTFSTQGPTKCSGIFIKQYDEEKLTHLFEKDFKKKTCSLVDHRTPSGSEQNFLFCHFEKKHQS